MSGEQAIALTSRTATVFTNASGSEGDENSLTRRGAASALETARIAYWATLVCGSRLWRRSVGWGVEGNVDYDISMSFHPNDVARRGRQASELLLVIIGFLLSAFFRTQILRNQQWVLQSEENRLREVPLPAPRGTIYDRNNKIIAENVVGYTVSVLVQSEDSLRGTLTRLGGTIQLTPQQANLAIRRYRRAPTRPTVILNDASFD